MAQIIASIDPKTWVTLAQFTYDCVGRYKLGGASMDPISDGYTAHVAILVSLKSRSFTLDIDLYHSGALRLTIRIYRLNLCRWREMMTTTMPKAHHVKDPARARVTVADAFQQVKIFGARWTNTFGMRSRSVAKI